MRKRLWIGTYVTLGVLAVYLILFPPKRTRNRGEDAPVPEAQLGSGSGCDANELPRSLSDTPPPSTDPSAPKDETPVMKQARQRITACVLHKLWPTASLQFQRDSKGTGHFDVVFPNNAYRRASAISLTQVSEDRRSLTFGAFVWLPHQRELALPPFVVARADSDGKVNYYNVLAVDDAVRITEDHLPEWAVRDGDDSFTFAYEGDYGSGVRIAWLAVVDGASAGLVERIPQRITLANGSWALTPEGSDGESELLKAEHGSEIRHVRVMCERSHGSRCVVSARELVKEISFARN
jgi:hypothetical protein